MTVLFPFTFLVAVNLFELSIYFSSYIIIHFSDFDFESHYSAKNIIFFGCALAENLKVDYGSQISLGEF